MVHGQRYDRARDTFLQFKGDLETQQDVLCELLTAIGLLIADYNTTYRENRFIVGGAVEEMLAAAMRCVGIADVRAVGVENIGHDILVGQTGFSLKTSFTGKSEAIGIINKQGSGSPVWTDPTIFVLAGGGIGYADPDLLPNATEDRSDQIALPRHVLYSFFENNSKWRLVCDVPIKPPTDEPPRSVASRTVAVEVLQRQLSGQPQFPCLGSYIY